MIDLRGILEIINDQDQTILDLSDKGLIASDILTLVEALNKNSHIVILDVGYNNIGDEGAKALAENKNITSLDVVHNNISTEVENACQARVNQNKQHFTDLCKKIFVFDRVDKSSRLSIKIISF